MNRTLRKYFKITLGGWRIMFGNCPHCNSDAPRLYDCPICQYNKIDKKFWWQRFLAYEQ